MMTTYFKPWRRKIGVVTLGLACVFAAGWVRSLYFPDVIEITVSNVRHVLLSGKSGLVWSSRNLTLRQEEPDGEHFMVFIGTATEWGPNAKGPGDWKYAGFDCRVRPQFHDGWWTIPYWSIVIPLTLLSAWLLLSKPRVVKPPEKQPQNF